MNPTSALKGLFFIHYYKQYIFTVVVLKMVKLKSYLGRDGRLLVLLRSMRILI